MDTENAMTAAPTPRDGERELYKRILDAYRIPTHFNLGVPVYDDNKGPELIAAHVAQRVAEAVGPLEAENRALREAAAAVLNARKEPPAKAHGCEVGE